MKYPHRIALFVCAAASLLATTTFAAESADQRIAILSKSVLKDAADLEQSALANPKAPQTIRQFVHAAYYFLTLGDNPTRDAARAEVMLNRAFAEQFMDPANPRFGDVPWTAGRPDINDPNSIEFTMSAVGPILMKDLSRLSPEFQQEWPAHVRAAVKAIQRHNVKVSYTNIYLMKAENLLLLGEALHDSAIEAEGIANFNHWIDFTRANGITEYDSTTYTSVQLDCLNEAYTYTSNAAFKPTLKAALDYMWSDVAANAFMPHGNLSGPHSRNYDFLTDTGPLDRQLYLEGIRNTLPTNTLLNDAGRAVCCAIDGGYHPAPAIVAYASLKDRLLLQQWGEERGKDRINLITPDFAIGSTSFYSGPQDKQLGVDFAAPESTPSVSLCVDGFDSPYGVLKFKGKDGHEKARKLKNTCAVVQDHATILALLNVTPDLGSLEITSLATNLLFPAKADEVMLDGKAVDMTKPFAHAVTPESVVALRVGNAGVAMRIFAADGIDNQKPTFELKLDKQGQELSTARLVAYHYRGNPDQPAKVAAKIARAGLIVTAGRCTSAQELVALSQSVASAKLDQETKGTVWQANLILPNTPTLTAALDCATGTIVARQVDRREAPRQRLTLNGQDLAAALLDSLSLPPAKSLSSAN